jgi:DNA-binding PadR family transcriptional regulator|tara:strand:+ start:115 stop:747 length:633 start_codon:yes stop_codon:yes gene_type:complete
VRYSFQDAKEIILVATYETLAFHSEYETFGSDKVHERVKGYFAPGYVARILRTLGEDGLVTLDQYDETAPTHYTLSDEGFEAAETLPPLPSLLEGQKLVPAANRTVSLGHNLPEHREIAKAFDEAIELAEATKPNGVSGDEHRTIVSGLKAARELWNAAELTQLQAKVGVIMALEAAQDQLKIAFQMARGSLLVEAIKLFFNSAAKANIF